MVLAQALRVKSPLQFTLTGNPSWLINIMISIGVVATICGVINIVRKEERGYVLAQALMSLTPGVLAMILIYSAYAEYSQLAASSTLPKPVEIVSIAGSLFWLGFLGLGSTIAPTLVAFCAFWRISAAQKR